MADKSKVTAAQRAALFSQATRQYMQTLPSMTFTEGQPVSQVLPKTRFLSKIFLLVKGTFKAKHASKTTFTKSNFDKYNLLKNVYISINNGFMPYKISGPMLSLYNKINNYKNVALADNYDTDLLENVVSADGASDKVQFILELPQTINDRDTIGLILLQNDATVVNIGADLGAVKDVMTDTDIEISDININITPIIVSYSVPAIPDAVPDYSILKIVNQETQNVVSAGEMIIKLPTQLTYRKMFIYVATDGKFTAMDHSLIKNFQIVFNQADTPYNIPADLVAYQNKVDYQGSLPAGCYAFDFSAQGIANMGGSRDYIDTERLSEFWLKITFGDITGNSNYVHIVRENLARLI
jgi:hypothetical protein